MPRSKSPAARTPTLRTTTGRNLDKRLPELVELETIIATLGNQARIRVETTTDGAAHHFPVYSLVFGATAPHAPTLCFIGGVHGLERIGTRVLLSYLKTMRELLAWDEMVHLALERIRVVFMPLLNPGGMYMRTRCNPNGIDLMRNAPVEADHLPRLSLLAGHRISPLLPWYRGAAGVDMQTEAQALCEVIRREAFSARVAVALDVHSGFGTVDRLWFPYARTRTPFPGLSEVMALKKLLDQTFPNHIYCVEPQSLQYTTHGDLWDYLYDEHAQIGKKQVFLPMALELGSWLWVKKNPKQLFTLLGAFNPLIPHRYQRTLRRHLVLFDFLLRAVLSHKTWAQLVPEQRAALHAEGLDHWYAEGA